MTEPVLYAVTESGGRYDDAWSTTTFASFDKAKLEAYIAAEEAKQAAKLAIAAEFHEFLKAQPPRPPLSARTSTKERILAERALREWETQVFGARDAWLKERNLTWQDTRVERVYYSIDVLPML